MNDKKSRFKSILLAGKLLLAAGLLVWVLCKAHWNDYIKLTSQAGGQTLSVVSGKIPADSEGKVSAQSGMLWWVKSREISLAQIEPVSQSDAGQKKIFIRKGIASIVTDCDKTLLIIATLLFPIVVILTAVRFWYLLSCQKIHITLGQSIRLTFLGQFFNMVVPGTVGGDLAKAWYINRHTKKTAEILMTVFLDRIIGLSEFVLMSAVMLSAVLLLGLVEFRLLKLPAIAVGCSAGAVVVALTFLLSRRVRQMFHLEKIYSKLSIAHHFKAAGKSVLVYRKKPAILLWALLITVGVHLCFIGAIALVGIALGLQVPLWSYFIFLPLIYVIGAIPITPGGVGVVENLYLKFFSVALVSAVSPDASVIVALAMIARLLPVFWSLGGLWVLITGPKLPASDAMQAQLDEDERIEEFTSETDQ